MNAPVVLFTYKRKTHAQQVVEALSKCARATETDLIIYADGAKSQSDLNEVLELRSYLPTISGFKSVTIHESETNKGLALSITQGVTDVVLTFGKVIVLEDDILVSPFFLDYMNDALDFYENEPKVMSISGYMYPHTKTLPETFFFNVPLCWGWATWKRAWSTYSNDTTDHYNYLNTQKEWKRFNKFGGTYLERQIRKNLTGKLTTWFINWHASVFRQNGYCLFPNITLVNNIGFDNSGENTSASNNFNDELAQRKIRVQSIPFKENSDATQIIQHFYRFKANKYIRAIKRFKKKVLKH